MINLSGEVMRGMVTSCEGRVSRNYCVRVLILIQLVTSREGRVSRNCLSFGFSEIPHVTSREGRVSRNHAKLQKCRQVAASRPVRDV